MKDKKLFEDWDLTERVFWKLVRMAVTMFSLASAPTVLGSLYRAGGDKNMVNLISVALIAILIWFAVDTFTGKGNGA